ncbi:IclR family transcriptional regulator [Comamonas flocculans]|uniref:IclR family transcriptional regulator n=1 Tax=Comamonas flocculans TaxID=2597701 RepID=A0A5B8RWN9_9BURK|nr:IclR family transcriptional regulator [Comamonas flocculans]QEA13971.1 IclR family transcriptional regulator [Comamonas flocculans]
MNDDSAASRPLLRPFELLEALAGAARPLTTAELVALLGWPKPSVHRLLVQLEAAELLRREPGSHRFTLAPRLLQLADSVQAASIPQGVRHAVLRQLVAQVGESCNLTALSGAQVHYLDRVESAFPLQMELRPGTRVPLHCSASGKLFLASLTPGRREQMLRTLPLTRYTATTLTERKALEAELAGIARQDYALDAEEFVQGLVCVAVPVRIPTQKAVRCALALQAPVARMSLEQALQHLPHLRQAATALARTWS